VREGILLVGVTRNSPAVVESLFGRGGMVLKADDFVAVLASYDAKSAQIAAAATRLNLGLDAFVFVDDNEVELEEVSRALPAVRCLRFPAREDDLAGLLTRLADWFGRETITAEDRERTAMYRRRLEGLVPEGHAGADIRGFLQSLAMRLEVADRSRGDRVRAVQLINKTNQFNTTTIRRTEAEVAALAADPRGLALQFRLLDRFGDNGIVSVMLLEPAGDALELVNWVMSCRVFGRQLEDEALNILADLARDRGVAAIRARLVPTPKNGVIAELFPRLGFRPDGEGRWTLTLEAHAARPTRISRKEAA
jgi:FkbH-like protein